MKIGRPKFKLAMEPHLLDEVRALHRETQDVRTKERALSVWLAAGGEHTYEQIAQTLGRSRSTVQLWIKGFENEGLASFSIRQGKGGGPRSPVQDPEVMQAIKQHLENGTWRTAAEARHWLESEKGIKLSLSGMYYWLGKLAGALKVPRPVHIKKNPAAL